MRSVSLASSRCIGSVVVALLLAGALLPVEGQAPLDVLGTHFGAVRRPVIANQAWLAGSAMLVTEFDGRLEADVPLPGNPPFIRHDNLDTTVGYNYVTVGGNWVATNNLQTWVSWLPTPTALTLAGSIHVGWTDDPWLTRRAQNALHDFRGVTRNPRDGSSDGHAIHGFDLEALVWPERKWLAIGGHVAVGGGRHEEAAAKMALVFRNFVQGHVTVTHGWIRTSSGPPGIASKLNDTYWALTGNLQFRERYGVSVGYDTGLFPGEREVLISLFLGVDVYSNWRVRGEFVNDLLGGKDRGPTGGGRLAIVYSY